MVVRELVIRMGFDLDSAKINQADQGIEKLKSRASSAIGAFGKLAAVVGVVLGAREIIQAADEWTNMYSRIGLVTKSTEEQAAMQEKVFAIAQKTRQEYSSTADLYVKMARNSKELGATQQDVLDATETVNKSLVIGGASTTEAKSTILQLGQALASGRLAGDELRSLSENAPLLFQAIADYYGVTIGKLKDMGAQGELTAEGVFKAILKAKSKMDKEFSKMPVTVGQAVTYSLNRIGKLIFNLNKETGVFQTIAKGIVTATEWIAGKIESAGKAVGGLGNLLKLAGIAVAALGAGMIALNWGAIVGGIKAIGAALNLLMSHPIVAVVFLLLLALEDLYTWIEGGDSIIGDWLGSWEEFKNANAKYIDPLISGFMRLVDAVQNDLIPTLSLIWDSVVKLAMAMKEAFAPIMEELTQFTNGGTVVMEILLVAWKAVVDGILLALQFFRQVFEGNFAGAIDTAAAYFKTLLNAAISILQQISSALSNYLQAKLSQLATAIGEAVINAWTKITDFFAEAIVQVNLWIESLKSGFFGAIDSIIQYFKNLLNEALSVLQQIANAIGRFVLDKLSQAKSSLLEFLGIGTRAPVQTAGNNNKNDPAAPMQTSGNNNNDPAAPVVNNNNVPLSPATPPPPYPSTPGVTAGGFAAQLAPPGMITINQQNQVNIEQNNAGSNLQPAAIGNSTANATTDAIDKMTRDWQFAM